MLFIVNTIFIFIQMLFNCFFLRETENNNLVLYIFVSGSVPAVREELPALIAEMLLILNEDWRRDMLRPVYTMRSIQCFTAAPLRGSRMLLSPITNCVCC